MGRNSHSNEDSEWRRKKEVEDAKWGCVSQVYLVVFWVGLLSYFFYGCYSKLKPAPAPAPAPTVVP